MVMSHTIRIYNRRHLKKTHRMIIEELPPSIRNMTEDERITYLNDPMRNSVHQYGFMYTPHGYLCMGRCPMCRDHTLNQRVQRKRRKMEFRRMVRQELE